MSLPERLLDLDRPFGREAHAATRRGGEAKVTPSSSTRRRWPRLKTWKPPESVRIGPSQPMNRCRPPEARDPLVAGAQGEVVGVGEDASGRPRSAGRSGSSALDRGLRADRHELRRVDGSVRRVQRPEPCQPDAGVAREENVMGEVTARIPARP